MAIFDRRLRDTINKALKSVEETITSHPIFAGMTLVDFSGIVKATDGVLSAAAIADSDIPDTITLANITQITNRSHTNLTDIGNLTHATIDGYLDQSVKQAANPTFAAVVIGSDGAGIDDQGTGDILLKTAANKTAVLERVVYDDLRVVPGSFDRPGVSDPSIVAYNVNGGGVNTYLWEFQVDDIAAFTVQMPHGYKQGTDITAHVHWTAGPRGTAESGKFVGWKLDYSWANIDGAFGTMATVDLSDACLSSNHIHQMSPEAAIDGHTAAKNISSMLICNIKRTDTGADDDWVGAASGQLPMLLEIDFHYQIDTMGSRQMGIK